jgi:hypothetical protein
MNNVITWTVALSALLLASPVARADEDKTRSAEDSATAKESQRPWGGSVHLESSIGRGTFIMNELVRRPYVNMLVSLRPHYTLSKKHKVATSLRVDVDKNLVENFDSENNSPRQVQLSDVRLATTWSEFARLDRAPVAFSTGATLYLPTSRLSRLATKRLGISADITTTYKPRSWLTASHSLSLTKNFNKFTTAALDDDAFDSPRLTRPGGAENIAEGFTAIGDNVIELGLANELSVSVTLVPKLTGSVSFALAQAWTYSTADTDEMSSPLANPGRGQRDIMYSGIDVSYEMVEKLTLSAGWVVSQMPKDSDNTDFRFPLWDMTNGSSNRQVFYLSAGYSL